MSFSSVFFLFLFLPISWIIYMFTPVKGKNMILTLMSMVFIAWGRGRFLLIALAIVAVTYAAGRLLEHWKESTKARIALIGGVSVDLLFLIYFKYFDFGIDTWNNLFGTDHALFGVLLPLGISFYIFSSISYLVDVYRGDAKPQRNVIDLACYLLLFIKFTQGPIESYKSFEPQLRARRVTLDELFYGIQRFSIGMGKKILIADTLGSTVDKIWNNMNWMGIDCPTAWLGAVAYMLQLYFDFSGYTDMAVGIGHMFGFHLMENFDYPYLSKSISEFWRRWHISLSSWFKNYLYIPLGGNRRGCVYVNLAIVFLATGIWHGAKMTFIVWGIWHGLFILVERFLRIHGGRFSLPGVVRWLITTLAVLVGWVMFRADHLSNGFLFLQHMFGITVEKDMEFSFPYYIDSKIIFLLVLGIFASTPVMRRVYRRWKERPVMEVAASLACMVILILSIITMVNSTYSPFLYFQF